MRGLLTSGRTALRISGTRRPPSVSGVRWHFIGHLQSNKARLVVGLATLIHSVDRIGLAEEIARRATDAGITQEVLIQVNVGDEASKHGAQPGRVVELAERHQGSTG